MEMPALNFVLEYVLTVAQPARNYAVLPQDKQPLDLICHLCDANSTTVDHASGPCITNCESLKHGCIMEDIPDASNQLCGSKTAW